MSAPTTTHRPSFTLVDPVRRTFRGLCDCGCRWQGPVVATEQAAIDSAEAFAGLTIRESVAAERRAQEQREYAAGRRAARGF